MSTVEKYKTERERRRAPTIQDAHGRVGGAITEAKRGDAMLARLALVSMLGTGWFAVGIAVMHVLRADLDPATHTISEYALGRYGPVQTVNFLAAGLGSVTLALALRRGVRRPGRGGPLLLGLWGVAEVVEAVVHADGDGPSTAAGSVHVLVSILGFTLGIAAMFVFARRFGQDPAWASFRHPTQLWAGAAIVTFLLIPFLGDARMGIGQRIFAAVLIGWLLETARRSYALSAVQPALSHIDHDSTKETT